MQPLVSFTCPVCRTYSCPVCHIPVTPPPLNNAEQQEQEQGMCGTLSPEEKVKREPVCESCANKGYKRIVPSYFYGPNITKHGREWHRGQRYTDESSSSDDETWRYDHPRHVRVVNLDNNTQ